MDRRKFLKASSAVSLGFLGLQSFVTQQALASESPTHIAAAGFGPLRKDPQGILNLPKGFSYKVISRTGDPMADGLLVPGKPDGMGTFPLSENRIIIIRNHEMDPERKEDGAFGPKNERLSSIDKQALYDYGKGELPGLGGTTTLIYNLRTQQVEQQYLSLAGTIRNCAGGPTPWNSWITCEETTVRAGKYLEKNHGYNFEVPASPIPKLAKPIPLKDMGRFNHEAICVDPRTSIIYQTEDRSDGLIYRFLPNVPGEPAKGGKLQIMALRPQKSFDTRNWRELKGPRLRPRQPIPVTWLDIDDIHAPEDDLRLRGFKKGAARFARGEGMWFGNNECYFACTNGGVLGYGQIFRYTPSPYEGRIRENGAPGMLELFAEPNNTRLVENCDNVTIAKFGDVVVCEDNFMPRIIGITPNGKIYHIAQNVGYQSEFAGACFSPDGSTLFVNIQHAGMTLAIWGPWEKRKS